MRTLMLGLLLTFAVALGACGGSSSDKAGGKRRADVTTLVFANGNGESDSLRPFAEAAKRLSGGTLDIRFEDAWRQGEPGYEAGLIRDVQAGEADLGWAGTRAFDDLGVPAFDALHAPLLIDSLELERAILEGPLPDRMLKGLEPLELVGLGILPGPLRKPLGVAPLVRPADYAGRTIALQRSRVGEQALRALGADGAAIASGAPIADYDGVEQHLGSIADNAYDDTAANLSANVNLWPRPPVVFANEKAFARLDERQRRALRAAARDALEPTLALERRHEAEGAAALCRRRAVFTTATDAELAGLRRALAPVYDRLRAEPATRAAIDEIRDRASELDAPADVAKCAAAGSAPRPGAATPIDGVYELDTTRDEVAEASGETPGETLSENYGHWRFDLARGLMRYTQESEGARRWTTATYRVRGDRLTVTITGFGGEAPNGAPERTGEIFDFAWSLDRGRLTLKPVEGKVSPPIFTVRAWRRR